MDFSDLKKSGKVFFTITDESEIKNGFQLKDGLNIIDSDEQVPQEFDCNYKPIVPNLLYFSEPKYICEYMAYGIYLREVYLPDDPKLKITRMKNFPCRKSMMYGANMIILGKKHKLSNPETYEYIEKCGGELRYDGDNALLMAVENGYYEVVKYLIDKGCDPSSDCDYALRTAAEKGYIDIVKLLLEKGADITSHNHWSLSFAALEGKFEMVKFLISRGADVRAKNYNPIKFALDGGHREIADYMLDLCPEIDSVSDDDDTYDSESYNYSENDHSGNDSESN